MWTVLALGLVAGLYAFVMVARAGAAFQALAVWLITAAWLVPWLVHAERAWAWNRRVVKKREGKKPSRCCGPARAPDRCWVLCGLGCSVVLSFLAFWIFLFLAAQQLPGYALVRSACGRSSCSSSSVLNPWAYNPRGFFPAPDGNDDVQSTTLALCPCPGCRWADVNNSLVKGYPAGSDGLPDRSQPPTPGGLATTNPADFPDLAVGIAGGLAVGETVADIVDCPGVYANLNPQGKAGKGGAICAQCTAYFQQYRGYNDPWTAQSCAGAQYRDGDEVWCWLCPPVEVCPYLGDIAAAFMLLFAVLAATTLLAAVCNVY